MESIDLEIRRRLDKLKEPANEIPSTDELEKRLRKLKNIPDPANVDKKYIVLPKPQLQTEQVDSLMKQFSEEVALSHCGSPQVPSDDIEQRLRNVNLAHSSTENDTKFLINKILSEADVEKRLECAFPGMVDKTDEFKHNQDKMNYFEPDSEEEFCSICDKTAKWICRDCDEEMFCTNCFKEYHDEIDENHNRTVFNNRK